MGLDGDGFPHTLTDSRPVRCFFSTQAVAILPISEAVPRKSMSGAPTPIYGMSCRSCFCNNCLCGTLFFFNEIVILALAVIAIVSNAWTVSQSGSLPGISQVGLWGISCGSASPGYVNAEGEYIASNITART